MTSVFFTRICDYLGKIKKDELESRQDSPSVVLTPRVSETVTLSQPHAAGNFSSCASIAARNLSAIASLFENAWHANSERWTAEGNLWLRPNQQAVVGRANETTDKELVRLEN